MKRYVKVGSLLTICLLLVTLLGACTPKVKLGDTELSLKKGELSIKDSKSGESVSVKEGKIEFTDDEGKSTVKVDEEGKVQITDDEGNAVMEMNEDGGLELPEGYPTDVLPVMKGTNIVMASKEDREHQLVFALGFQIDAEPVDVYEFYHEAMKDAEELFKMEMENSYTLGGILQDYSITILINESEFDDSTSVTLGLEKDK